MTAQQRGFDLHLHHRGAHQHLCFKGAVLDAVHPHAAPLSFRKRIAQAGDAVVDVAQNGVNMGVCGGEVGGKVMVGVCPLHKGEGGG